MSQLASNAPPAAAPASKRTRPPSRDAFIVVTIALVAAAVGLGAYLQTEAGPVLAAVLALLSASTLATVHLLVRRGRTIAELNSEVARLGGGSIGATSRPAPDAPRRRNEARPDAVAPPAPRPAPAMRQPGAVDQARPVSMGAPGTVSASPPPLAVAAVTQAAAVLGNPALGAPGHGIPAPFLPVAATAPMAAAITSRPQTARNETARSEPPPLPNAQARPAAAAPPSPVPMARHSMAPEMPVRPRGDASPPPHPLAAKPPVEPVKSVATDASVDPVMGPAWAHRPGSQREPFMAAPPGIERTAGRGSPPPSPADDPGPDMRELATMQTLIEQLAAQLNAPRRPAEVSSAANHQATKPDALVVPTARANPAPLVRATPEAAVRQSVDVLKATADTMRGAEAAPDVTRARPAEKASPQLPRAAEANPSPAHAPTPAAATATAADSPYGRLASISEAVNADRIDLLLDPILGLEDRKARHFEVSVRLRGSDGQAIAAEDVLDVAAGTGLLARIDAAKLARAARIADRLNARGTSASLFSNLAGESLADDVFLDAFADTLVERESLGHRLVLSFAQGDVRSFNDGQWEAVATMADVGLRFALEDVADLDMDFERLREHGFKFIKLDSSVFLDGLPAAEGPIPAADLCRHLAGHGLGLIVGAIEDETALAKILGFGVLFGQGMLFGGPRPVKVDMSPAPSVAAA